MIQWVMPEERIMHVPPHGTDNSIKKFLEKRSGRGNCQGPIVGCGIILIAIVTVAGIGSYLFGNNLIRP